MLKRLNIGFTSKCKFKLHLEHERHCKFRFGLSHSSNPANWCVTVTIHYPLQLLVRFGGEKPLHCAKWVYSYRLCELVKHFFHKEGQVKADMPKYHGACLSKANESKLCEAKRRCSAETERRLVNLKGLHLHLLIIAETKQKCAKECLLN